MGRDVFGVIREHPHKGTQATSWSVQRNMAPNGWFGAELIVNQVKELKKLWKNKRQLLFQALNLAMIVFSALMIWKSLMWLTKSESPVVVVLSGSMEPAFQRGDILFLNNQNDPIRVGEIVVFKIKDRDIPIVHRVMKVHEKASGEVCILLHPSPSL